MSEAVKRKLTSRKWWLAVTSFVVALVTLIAGESEAQQIGALLLLAADVIGYSIGEGLADNGNATN